MLFPTNGQEFEPDTFVAPSVSTRIGFDGDATVEASGNLVLKGAMVKIN